MRGLNDKQCRRGARLIVSPAANCNTATNAGGFAGDSVTATLKLLQRYVPPAQWAPGA
jgi:hypothetical protein